VYATDRNYAPICATSMVSLLENNKDCRDNIFIYLFSYKLEDLEDQFRGLVEKYGRQLEVIQSGSIINKFRNLNVPKVNGSYSAYIRLYASEYLVWLDKFLYLDCDTLVMHNINELYGADIEGYAAGAICDGMTSRCNIPLGRAMDSLYFNSGVMLVNAKYWREKNVLGQVINDLNQYRLDRTATGSDQEMINYTLGKKIMKLPLRYNVLVQNRIYTPEYMLFMIEKNENNYYCRSEMQSAKDDPFIVHFAGNMLIRPWFSNSMDPLVKTWDHYLEMTPWNGYKKKRQNISIWKVVCIWSVNRLPKGFYAFLKKYEDRLKHWKIRNKGA